MSACVQHRVNVVATPHAKAKAEQSILLPLSSVAARPAESITQKLIHVPHIDPPSALVLLAVLLLVIPVHLSQQPGPLHNPLNCSRHLGMKENLLRPSDKIRQPPL